MSGWLPPLAVEVCVCVYAKLRDARLERRRRSRRGPLPHRAGGGGGSRQTAWQGWGAPRLAAEASSLPPLRHTPARPSLARSLARSLPRGGVYLRVRVCVSVSLAPLLSSSSSSPTHWILPSRRDRRRRRASISLSPAMNPAEGAAEEGAVPDSEVDAFFRTGSEAAREGTGGRGGGSPARLPAPRRDLEAGGRASRGDARRGVGAPLCAGGRGAVGRGSLKAGVAPEEFCSPRSPATLRPALFSPVPAGTSPLAARPPLSRQTGGHWPRRSPVAAPNNASRVLPGFGLFPRLGGGGGGGGARHAR